FVAEQSSGCGTAAASAPLPQFRQQTRATKMTALGQTRRAIAEGYIPGQSSFSEPALISHETACMAHVRITIFFILCRSGAGRALSRHRPAAAHAAFAFQRSRAARTDSARHAVLVIIRFRCTDRGATHAARFATR